LSAKISAAAALSAATPTRLSRPTATRVLRDELAPLR